MLCIVRVGAWFIGAGPAFGGGKVAYSKQEALSANAVLIQDVWFDV